MSIRAWLLVPMLAGLVACGDGDTTALSSNAQGVGDPAPAPNPGVPITCAVDPASPAWSAGGIEGTGFGPARRKLANLLVAGQTWDVAHAAVLIDGRPATGEQIADGTITTVQGTLAATGPATADAVVSESRVAGPITSVSDNGIDLVVLGQPVVVQQDTQMPPPPALVVGDTVEVNALASANGILVATRIARRAADLEYFVTGTVSAHDDSAHTLVINALTVDYSGVVLQGFPTDAVRDGDLVRVFGHLGGGLTLSARAVEFRPATLPGAAGTHISLYGYITRLVSDADFDVEGVPISTTSATDFEVGGALALSQVVVVCGTLTGAGTVAATQVLGTWDY
jgi:hypothetical protein